MRIRNWETFQHYKDRNPPWIKLHRSLLDDVEFFSLSLDARAVLPMLWLLAAQDEGHIPNNPVESAWRLRIDEQTIQAVYQELYDAQFIVEDGERREKARWPSRYIPVAMRAQVLERDARTCKKCGSKENIEVDHIKPVSKGGVSALDNLQVLCRPCNRAKRTAEWVATQNAGKRSKALRAQPEQRSLETETYKPETEEEREKEALKSALADWIPIKKWEQFLEMRQRVKAPITDHGKYLAMLELKKLQASGQDPGAVLDQSVLKSWKGLFPVSGGANGKRESVFERMAEELDQKDRNGLPHV